MSEQRVGKAISDDTLQELTEEFDTSVDSDFDRAMLAALLELAARRRVADERADGDAYPPHVRSREYWDEKRDKEIEQLTRALVQQEGVLKECEALLREAVRESGIDCDFEARFEAYWKKSAALSDWRTRDLALPEVTV